MSKSAPKRAESIGQGGEVDEAEAWLDAKPRLTESTARLLDLMPVSRPYALADVMARRSVRTWFDDATIKPVESLGIGVEGRMDLEAVVAHSAWEGGVKAPREQRRDEYPVELEERMRDCERPFVLRNLSRVVRDADPDEPLELKSESHAVSNLDGPSKEVAALMRYAPPKLHDETSLDTVNAELAWRHFMCREMVWGDYFSAEVRRRYQGGLWKRTTAIVEAERLAEEGGNLADEPGDASQRNGGET